MVKLECASCNSNKNPRPFSSWGIPSPLDAVALFQEAHHNICAGVTEAPVSCTSKMGIRANLFPASSQLARANTLRSHFGKLPSDQTIGSSLPLLVEVESILPRHRASVHYM